MVGPVAKILRDRWRYFHQARAMGVQICVLGCSHSPSTRRDTFTAAFCAAFAKLVDGTLPHSWDTTCRILEEDLGDVWRNGTITVDGTDALLGSGCVAQVYKGALRRVLRVWSPLSYLCLYRRARFAGARVGILRLLFHVVARKCNSIVDTAQCVFINLNQFLDNSELMTSKTRDA
eukprot:m.593978 g.593978  ORF g.593978 m.593978 type:complete len:176 (+) comp22398_c0_seq12:1010-1537(+)